MIDEIKKKIAADNKVLDVLPQNSANNRKKYREQLDAIKADYLSKQKEVLNFIKNKNSLLSQKYNLPHENKLEKSIILLGKRLNYFNPHQTPYEILGLDKLFYGLYKYYDNDLSFYNSNINKILDIFEQADIVLTKKDFYFSNSAEEYMSVLLSERKNGNFNSPLVKETFESLFWKSHDMMRYILLNFKYLYFSNEKKFDTYVTKARKLILSEYNNSYDVLLNKYRELVTQSNEDYLHNAGVFYEKFINNEINPSDYEKDKIDKLASEYMDNSITNRKDLFSKLYASINEERFIYQNRLVLDEVDKLYQEKDNYKNLVSDTNKEISGLIKKIQKNRKKLKSKGLFKPKNPNLLKKEVEDSLNELGDKYELLEENRYKEKIASLVNPTIKDYYLIGKSYLFMKKICEDKDIDVDEAIKEIDSNLYSPYNALIENIKYKNVDDLNLIVFDKYRLLGLSLTVDSFTVDNLDSFNKAIGNIIIYYALEDLKVDIDEIDFILESDEIIKKVS
jgi:hypothetical protein